MDKSSKIKDLLRSISGTDKARYQFRLMEVVAVEGDLCRAKLGSFEIPGIHLASITQGSENGILVTPTIGSTILVADISNGELRELVAVSYSEIDSIRIHKEDTTIFTDHESVSVEVGESRVEITDGKINIQADNSQIEMTKDLIQINGGENDGLIKISDLVNKLNIVEDEINELKDLIKKWNPTGTLGDAAALKTALTKWLASSIENTTQDDLENTNVTH